MFYKDERLALFIDGSNLYAAAKALGFDIDYKLLRQEFMRRGKLLHEQLGLNEMAVQATRDPALSKRIADQGGFPQPGSPDDFARFIASEIKTWGEVVRASQT